MHSQSMYATPMSLGVLHVEGVQVYTMGHVPNKLLVYRDQIILFSKAPKPGACF